MNLVILTGRLTRDPDVHITQSGSKYVTYTLAVDRRGEGTDFINCKAFGKPAEWIEKYLRKGTKINAEGRIQTGSYQNKEGKTVYTCDIVTLQHEFCEPKNAPRSPEQSAGGEILRQESNGGFSPVLEGEEEYLPFK